MFRIVSDIVQQETCKSIINDNKNAGEDPANDFHRVWPNLSFFVNNPEKWTEWTRQWTREWTHKSQ